MVGTAAVPEGGIPRHASLALAAALHQALIVHEDPACSARPGRTGVGLGAAGTVATAPAVGLAKRGYVFLSVRQARLGADFDFLRDGSGSPVPRDSH